MEPKTGYESKWTVFRPGSVVRVLNPLSFDMIFRYSEEDKQYEVVLPKGEVSELPGGNCATQGVKRIVDELIQNDKHDAMLMWDETVRKKYEDQIIVHFKEAPGRIKEESSAGPINLSIKGQESEQPEPEAEKEEVAFPSKQVAKKV